METPASISNSARAATLIQRAFRGAQGRIAAEQRTSAPPVRDGERTRPGSIAGRRHEQGQPHARGLHLHRRVKLGAAARRGDDARAHPSPDQQALPTLPPEACKSHRGARRARRGDGGRARHPQGGDGFVHERTQRRGHVPENGRCIVVGDLHGQLVRERNAAAPTPRKSLLPRGSPRDTASDPRILGGSFSSASSVLPPFESSAGLLLRVILASRPFPSPHPGRFPFLVRTTSFTSSASSARRAGVYVFNGDLVDRGDHGCELVLLVFALKLQAPRYASTAGTTRSRTSTHYSGFEEVHLEVRPPRVPDVPPRVRVAAVRRRRERRDARASRRLTAEWRDVGVADLRGWRRPGRVLGGRTGGRVWIGTSCGATRTPTDVPRVRGVRARRRVLWARTSPGLLEKEGLRAIVRSHQCVAASR